MKLLHAAMALCFGFAASAPLADAASSWPMRGRNLQRTAIGGTGFGLTVGSMPRLKTTGVLETEGVVNATPVISDTGLLVAGDWAGNLYVFDVESGRRLVKLEIGEVSGTPQAEGDLPFDAQPGLANAIQSAAAIGRVTTASGAEVLRAYYAANSETTVGCLDLDAIGRDRATLNDDDGSAYACGAPWPMKAVADGATPVVYGTITLSENHPMGEGADADLLLIPTAGTSCDPGALLAVDAATGEEYWRFEEGGVITTAPAMDRSQSTIYVATSECPIVASAAPMANSLVALDGATGAPLWHHRRRVFDPLLAGIGNSPTVVDDDGLKGCHVVASSDRDGCIYVFEQAADVLDPGDAEFDPLRPGQQRIRSRNCLVPGSQHGGFNAGSPAARVNWVTQQTSGFAGHANADDANAFTIGVCGGEKDGEVEWASSTIPNGMTDAAGASDMFIYVGTRRRPEPCTAGGFLDLNVNDPSNPTIGIKPPTADDVECSYDPTTDVGRFEDANVLVVTITGGEFDPEPHLFATLDLQHEPTPWGGGPAVYRGQIFVPGTAGIEIITPQPLGEPETAKPRNRGLNNYLGPYPHPLAPAVSPVFGDRQVQPHPQKKSEHRTLRYRD